MYKRVLFYFFKKYLASSCLGAIAISAVNIKTQPCCHGASTLSIPLLSPRENGQIHIRLGEVSTKKRKAFILI